MSTKVVLDGNRAIAQAACLSRVEVVATYPITPQSSIAETLAGMVGKGQLDAHYLRVESEHSALAAAIGASLVGARPFTATSSVGLALMHEVLGVAAGCRQPIVMAVVNRALLGPWNIWGDQSDAMGARDQGWLSLFAETAQEAFDLVVMGYRIAEDRRVLLPIMVNIDGFFLSHVTEVLWLPDKEEVDSFLPRRSVSPVRLDLDEPMVVNPLTPPGEYAEVRHQHSLAMEASRTVIDEVMAEFDRRFDRSYCQVDSFGQSAADLVLIATGSVCGTIRHTIQKRELADAVRLIKLTTLRPFPKEPLRSLCQGARAVGVVERSPALGHDGPLTSEVRAALYDLGEPLPVIGYVAGLGGRDIPPTTIIRMVESLSKVKDSSLAPSRSVWIDLREETASHE